MSINTYQEGAALLVSLMMLVILTLLGISAVNMSTINFKITANRQSSMDVSNRTQNGIETILSDIDYFNIPTGTINLTSREPVSNTNLNIAVRERRCYFKKKASGYSLTWGLAPEDTRWEVVADINDPVTGANTTIHQGVAIRMTSGACP